MTQILMPALSPTMEEGKLAKWHVKEGDTVKTGDILAEIETDKATMEFESIDEGRLAKLLAPEGTEGVKVNAPIAELAQDGEAAPARAPAPRPAPAPAAKISSPRAGAGEGEGAKQPSGPKPSQPTPAIASDPAIPAGT